MKITFFIPGEKLAADCARLLSDLERSLPDVALSVNEKKEHLVLELAPDADPIDVVARMQKCLEGYDIELVRIPNEPVEKKRESEIEHYKEASAFTEKTPRMMKMSQFVVALVVAVLLCSVLMFSLASSLFSSPADQFSPTLGVGEEQSEDYAAKIALIDFIFKNYAYKDVDGQQQLDEMLRAYVEATGDRYAAYYTAEEFQQMLSDMEGNAVGVGITVTKDSESENICILQVSPDSPAAQAGVLPGDVIVAIGTLEQNERVGDIGYEKAMQKMQGEEDTVANFIVLRDGDEHAFSIVRKPFIAVSVQGNVSKTDPTVGIVRIFSFEANTPAQLKAEMKKLLDAGCNRFVYDVRNNPGGELRSVRAVLSYFANKGDMVTSTVYKDGSVVEYKATAISYAAPYAACSVTETEIGMYRAYPAVVLVNGNTASAAELFTAGLRDYGVAEVVGENTYGKGVIQTVFDLAELGSSYDMTLTGGLKLTVGYYSPPSGENYDGKGIAPDLPVVLSEEVQGKNLYLLDETADNQLQAAIHATLSK